MARCVKKCRAPWVSSVHSAFGRGEKDSPMSGRQQELRELVVGAAGFEPGISCANVKAETLKRLVCPVFPSGSCPSYGLAGRLALGTISNFHISATGSSHLEHHSNTTAHDGRHTRLTHQLRAFPPRKNSGRYLTLSEVGLFSHLRSG
jgi:hypothetical protein